MGGSTQEVAAWVMARLMRPGLSDSLRARWGKTNSR